MVAVIVRQPGTTSGYLVPCAEAIMPSLPLHAGPVRDSSARSTSLPSPKCSTTSAIQYPSMIPPLQPLACMEAGRSGRQVTSVASGKPGKDGRRLFPGPNSSTCCIIRNLGFHIDFFPWKSHKMDSEGIRSRHGQAPPVPDTSYGWAMDGSESDDEHVVDSSIPSTPFEQDFDAEGFHADGPLTAGPTEPLSEQKVVSEDDAEEEHDTGDDRQCRICFGGADDEDVLGRLISPCLCTGSVRVSCCDASDLPCADDSMSTVSRYIL